MGSGNGLAAIYWRRVAASDKCKLIVRRRDLVAANWAGINIVSCYISPNVPHSEFLEFVDDLEAIVGLLKDRLLICGDFNSKSVFWGCSHTNTRGRTIEEWAAQCELRLVNVGSVPTCVRPQGCSVVDLTWCTPDILGCLSDWAVREYIESLSDHQYVVMNLAQGVEVTGSRRAQGPRWNWKTWDADMFQAAASLEFAQPIMNARCSLDERVRRIERALQAACDAAMKRIQPGPYKRRVYWWCETVATARRTSIQFRRRWSRARRRNGDADWVQALREEYNAARRRFRREINRAKLSAWQELIGTVEEDPWGLPYRVVLNKLRNASHNIMESLEPEVLARTLDELFPRERRDTYLNGLGDVPGGDTYLGDDGSPSCSDRGIPGSPGESFSSADLVAPGESVEETDLVTPAEIGKIIAQKGGKNTAPGRDGIRLRAMRAIPEEGASGLVDCFNRCLKEGKFPVPWKRALLVLIPKGWPIDTANPRLRPICLLNDIGKVLETVLVDRLTRWMADNPTAQLSANQFGFRRGKSTCDALKMVQSAICGVEERGGVTIAISLDICNAFNSLPWRVINTALRSKSLPVYLRRVIEDYLSHRSVEYVNGKGRRVVRQVMAGVPQGSVLGPILWNIGYDRVLSEGANYGCSVICYADDTLILAAADDVSTATARASVQANGVLSRIEALGLTVAVGKTEAVCFPGRHRLERRPVLDVGGTAVATRLSMKYLGVILDARMNFRDHLDYVEQKVGSVARALGRLMPNLRGPSERRRRLYANVVLSIVLYAAPIWSEAVSRSRKRRQQLNNIMRTTCLRVIAAYRTVSLDAASLLAGIPPAHLSAQLRARIFARVADLRRSGSWTLREVGSIHAEEVALLCRQWSIYAQRPDAAGTRTRDAIVPNLGDWLSRGYGSVGFHLTQLLTGHGVFGSYLARIRKVETSQCEHCEDGVEDTPEHTLRACAAWSHEREILKKSVGRDLRLPAVIRACLDSWKAWNAMTLFADRVMVEKERRERARQLGGEEESVGPPDSSSSSQIDSGESGAAAGS